MAVTLTNFFRAAATRSASTFTSTTTTRTTRTLLLSPSPSLSRYRSFSGWSPFDSSDDEGEDDEFKELKKCSTELTEMAKKGELEPVIGREDEIQRCMQILTRKFKNNPVLIGDPGVGKTTIVEGLAQRIASGNVPKPLLDLKVFSLSIASVIAGQTYFGQLEKRMQKIMREITDSNGKVILFINDIQNIVGAGAGGGKNVDIASMMKPTLVRGKIRCIGASTPKGYKQYIEKDPSIERSFQRVLCAQPTVDQTIVVLRGLRERYELHHGVKISDSALVAAAQLSDRYINDRFLPEKAIDLVDEAASKVKMDVQFKPKELTTIDADLSRLETEKKHLQEEPVEGSGERLKKLEEELPILREKQKKLNKQWECDKSIFDCSSKVCTYNNEIKKLLQEIEDVKKDHGLMDSSQVRYETIRSLKKQLVEADKILHKSREVVDTDIQEVLTKWTGIPVAKSPQLDSAKLLVLEKVLHGRVIGQDIAVNSIADAIRRSVAGLCDPKRPIASFMFMGPTGVGKTELAKALASYLFSSENALVRLDMSEYMETNSVARLIGSAPGLANHEEGGQLTEQVRRRPYSVVLFDEIEKAHPDVLNLLLQLLDDGRLTDSSGRTVNFKNCMIIMTSNVGSRVILDTLQDSRDSKEAMYDLMKSRVVELASSKFRPEFMNRVDDFIVFQPLSPEEIGHVVDIQMNSLMKRVKDRKIDMSCTKQAVDLIVELGYDQNYGARPVKRVIQQRVENAIAKKILQEEIKENDSIVVDVDASSLTGDLSKNGFLIKKQDHEHSINGESRASDNSTVGSSQTEGEEEKEGNLFAVAN